MSRSKHQLDIEMVKAIKRGDQAAFERFFVLMRKKVYYFVFSYAKSEYVADEIVQEVFIRIWQKRDKIKPATFHTLIFIMARNLTFNHLRDTMRREVAKEELWNGITEQYDQIETQLFYKEYCKVIAGIVDKLPQQKKKIYRLSRQEGRSNAEIAEMLGITPKTVKNHLWKIMEAIKAGVRPFTEGSLLLILSFLLS
ncbi:RNA polymerase sigma factor [Sinomicrobium soli]|uniref:RNA polymerase sigma factor n=1 Tax=Sinomicrobium sp. N-1-3-6 TaxID=2219864 RepID=UPI000DCAFDD9|nr:RNA polymerase sigma-70 factor [Sinomicrobium sp. N-1-3-6]RAV30844.1 hypothetical protein DN748_00875 [Sinomicrobium sp. N-1-3-6]